MDTFLYIHNRKHSVLIDMSLKHFAGCTKEKRSKEKRDPRDPSEVLESLSVQETVSESLLGKRSEFFLRYVCSE